MRWDVALPCGGCRAFSLQFEILNTGKIHSIFIKALSAPYVERHRVAETMLRTGCSEHQYKFYTIIWRKTSADVGVSTLIKSNCPQFFY